MKKLYLLQIFYFIFFSIKPNFFAIHVINGTKKFNVYKYKENQLKGNPFQTSQLIFSSQNISNNINFKNIFKNLKNKKGIKFFFIKTAELSHEEEKSKITIKNKNNILEYLILQSYKNKLRLDLSENESIYEFLKSKTDFDENFFKTLLSDNNNLFKICLKNFNLDKEIKKEKSTIIFDKSGNFFGEKFDCKIFKKKYLPEYNDDTGFVICLYNKKDKNIIGQSTFLINSGKTSIGTLSVNNPFIGYGFGSSLVKKIEKFSLDYSNKIELKTFPEIKNFYVTLGFMPIGFDEKGFIKMEKYI